MAGPTKPRQDPPTPTPAAPTPIAGEEISSRQMNNNQEFASQKLPKFEPNTLSSPTAAALPRTRFQLSKGSCSAKYSKRPYILYIPHPTVAENRNTTNKHKASFKQQRIFNSKSTKNAKNIIHNKIKIKTKLPTSFKVTTTLSNSQHIPTQNQKQTPGCQTCQQLKVQESHEWNIDPADEDNTVNPQATPQISS